MIKRFIINLLHMLFIGELPKITYFIRNGKVTITGFRDDGCESLNIPESINGYQVTNIRSYASFQLDKLKYVNGVKIERGVNIINNKFILFYIPERVFDKFIYKIKYKINDDYMDDSDNPNMFINNTMFTKIG